MNFHNFDSDEKFDLQGEYSKLAETAEKIVTPQDQKISDAETIINELGSKHVEGLSLDNYENLYNNINAFLDQYSTDSENVTIMTKEDRDKLFGYAINMYKQYEYLYQNLTFSFEVSAEEWHFIDNVLNKKLKYNGNELFNYWQLRIDFLDPVGKQFKELPDEIPGLVINTSVKNMILLSHLLMKHEESGNTKSFYHFKNLLFEIAQMTKLFNAYGVVAERISSKFNTWVNTLNALDGFNDETMRINNMEDVEAEVVE